MTTLEAQAKQKHKKTTMTKERKKCVEIAKKIAKVRDKFTCQRCLRKVEGVNCQWSHIIPENRDKKLSCNPLNIKVLCYNCHALRHEHPTKASEWINNKRPDRMKYLNDEHRKIDWTIWAEYFITELVKLKEQLKQLWWYK